MKIAIQGIQGSNHYIVAQNYFGADAAIEECLLLCDKFDVCTNIFFSIRKIKKTSLKFIM